MTSNGAIIEEIVDYYGRQLHHIAALRAPDLSGFAANPEEPTRKFEPRTPSLRGLISCRRGTHAVGRGHMSPGGLLAHEWQRRGKEPR